MAVYITILWIFEPKSGCFLPKLCYKDIVFLNWERLYPCGRFYDKLMKFLEPTRRVFCKNCPIKTLIFFKTGKGSTPWPFIWQKYEFFNLTRRVFAKIVIFWHENVCITNMSIHSFPKWPLGNSNITLSTSFLLTINHINYIKTITG